MAGPTYHVVQLLVPTPEIDRVQGELYELGEAHVTLKAYFDAHCSLEELKKKIAERAAEAEWLSGTTIGLTDVTFRPAPFEPFHLVSNLTVVPPPELTGSDQTRDPNHIVLMPGLAFGTGRHETTRLVARALWHLKPPPASVLDVGTGSGILAIVAHKIGVSVIDAVEISEEALRNARENMDRNGCSKIGLYRSLNDVQRRYDVLLGNLLTPTILHLKPFLDRRLNPGGRLILSGITVDEADELADQFRDYKQLQRNDTDDWSCFTFAKPG